MSQAWRSGRRPDTGPKRSIVSNISIRLSARSTPSEDDRRNRIEKVEARPVSDLSGKGLTERRGDIGGGLPCMLATRILSFLSVRPG
jgi:hypothetical protein